MLMLANELTVIACQSSFEFTLATVMPAVQQARMFLKLCPSTSLMAPSFSTE